MRSTDGNKEAGENNEESAVTGLGSPFLAETGIPEKGIASSTVPSITSDTTSKPLSQLNNGHQMGVSRFRDGRVEQKLEATTGELPASTDLETDDAIQPQKASLSASAAGNLNQNFKEWDPLHTDSFGVSSDIEAQFSILPLTKAAGYCLSAEEHKKLREERGVRLPFVEGDTVTHKEAFGASEGTVVASITNDDGLFELDVDFEGGGRRTYIENIENIDMTDEEAEETKLFPFQIKNLARRCPDEIWLRSDLALLNTTIEVAGKPAAEDDAEPPMADTNAGASHAKKHKHDTDEVCCICLETKPNVFSGLCNPQPLVNPTPSQYAQSTPSTQTMPCIAAICESCFSRYCEVAIGGMRYGANPLRCPAPNCSRRLPMEVWTCRVSKVSLLQYVRAPRQLLTIRCPCCDRVRGLFPRLCVGSDARRALFRRAFGALPSKNDDGRGAIADFVAAWRLFSSGGATAGETIERFERISGFADSSALFKLLVGEWDFQDEETFGGGLLSLVVDVERRAALTIAFLRAHPCVTLGCCGARVCFTCKTEGHHEGKSCEEMLRAETAIQAQFCPGCGVPTILSEGCDHIICVCGRQWLWKSES